MNRSLHLRSILAASSLVLASPIGWSRPAYDGLTPDKPLNVLFIMSDQHSVRTMGCYQNGFGGLSQSLTPNLDQLASEGAKFDNAICVTPQCTPSRFTLLTGQWPHNHGIRWNEIWEMRKRWTLPRALRDSGFETGTIGKHHFFWLDQNLPLIEDHGFNRILDLQDLWNYSLASGVPIAWDPSNIVLMPNLPSLNFTGYTLSLNEFHPAGHFADQVIEFLEDRAGPGGDGKPFFCMYSMEGPHTPLLPSGVTDPHDWAHMYHPFDGLGLPPNMDKVPTTQRLAIKQAQYAAVTDSQWREILSYYYGLITQIDFNIGRVLTRLEELGLADNTLVVYTADHGEMASEMSVWTKGAGSYDATAKIPLLIRLPGIVPAGKVTDELVSNLDLVPTLIELTGVPTSEADLLRLDGRSLVDLLTKDQVQGWPQEAFMEFGDPHVSRTRMVRTKTGKYSYDERNGGEEEYYDLVADEYEIDNLILSPDQAVQDAILDLENRLDAWWNDEVGHAPAHSVAGGVDAIPQRPEDPVPCDGAIDVPRNVDLSWLAPTASVTQRVYLGSSGTDPSLFSEVDGTVSSINPGNLLPNKTYYWRILAENENGIAPSLIWSFTTSVGPGGPARVAANPSPGHESQDNGLFAQLAWNPGSTATSQDLYFGPVGAMALIGFSLPGTQTAYDPGPLQGGVVYEWRIDAANADGTTEGDVWRFATDASGLPERAIVVHPEHMDEAAVPHEALGLRWQAGSGALSHDVYFGTMLPPPFVGNSTDTHFDPGPLDFGVTYYWRIDEVNISGVRMGWTWRFTRADCGNAAPIGTNYCTPVANSTGLPGLISAVGNPDVSANCLRLVASSLPAGETGIFLTSLTPGFFQNPGGSAGNLCLWPEIARFGTQVQVSSSLGEYGIDVDMTQVPTSPAQPILAGTTWNFQSWYRDGSTSNLTDAIAITFQ